MKKLLSHQSGEAYAFLFGQCTTHLQHRIEAKAEHESKIKGDPIKLLETIKENSLSFDDKKKAITVVLDAIMKLMTTRQRDNEDLTDYTKCFKGVRDLCKEKYRGIFEISMFTQKESSWTSDEESNFKTAYANFLSMLYLIKRMAEDFVTGQENVYPSISRMHNIFCPSINMTKLIMISEKSNKMIVTKVTCP